jgi:hypothetical protein
MLPTIPGSADAASVHLLKTVEDTATERFDTTKVTLQDARPVDDEREHRP